MKTLACSLLGIWAIAAASICTSCINAGGDGSQWHITAVGTDADQIEAAAAGFKAQGMKNSTALKMVVDPVMRYITVAGAVKMIRDGLAYFKVLDNNRVALFKAGTDRQIGLVQAKSAADVAQLDAASRAALAAKAP
jgi:hypothetical protein